MLGQGKVDLVYAAMNSCLRNLELPYGHSNSVHVYGLPDYQDELLSVEISGKTHAVFHILKILQMTYM